ncbi:hypothetical protein O181_057425 [Austropuccinia psidii MF-1]|uniref:Dynactin subunit 4 n=1 Tax=Austropuccinia psidii MF-1 TaxID=1389203 RepID=A0A9Q3E7W8_9BASI|nr:hypothetical protein [Austropuccinia psidii MF-1]
MITSGVSLVSDLHCPWSSSGFRSQSLPAMSSSVYYLCPHTAPISAIPPEDDLPSSLGLHYHPLSSLLFCEECDAIRCDQCVSCELNCYYCPNCLFEVPSANIRSQKNRCGRNCFLCPQCRNTLSAVATDPPSSSFQDDLRTPQASIGEPPYFLYCTFCRWDSKEVGISFEKPTFLAQQLQQAESSPPELLEFERLKEHFELFLKSQNALSPSPSTQPHRAGGGPSTSSSAQLAASLALSKEVPNLTKYGTQLGLSSSAFKIRSHHSLLGSSTSMLPTNLNPDGTWREDLAPYQALFPYGPKKQASAPESEQNQTRLRGNHFDPVRRDDLTVEEMVPLEKRWNEVWENVERVNDLKPVRVPLRSKRTKRCPTCEHILIKPEQKAQSIRFKIKLIASNYLPLIDLQRKRLATPSKYLVADRLTSGVSAARKSAAASRAGTSVGNNPLLGRSGEVPDEVIRPDREYQFELTFVNPLYEPINVRLSIPPPKPISSNLDGVAPQLPYTVRLLASEFTIAAFAEVWEYDEDEEAEGENDEAFDPNESDNVGTLKRNRLSTFGLIDSVRRRTLQTNAVTKKANRTTILVEVKTSKQFVGTLEADMLVTFTYRSDELHDEMDESTHVHGYGKKNSHLTDDDDDDDDDENQKSFTFWTKLTFGEVVAPLALATPGSTLNAASTRKKPSLVAE